MPDFTHPKAVTGTPVIVTRVTGYYVNFGDGGSYADPAGHTWFAKNVARAIAYELKGDYHQGGSGTMKQVVTGYLPPADPCGCVTGTHPGRPCPWAEATPAPDPVYVQHRLFNPEPHHQPALIGRGSMPTAGRVRQLQALGKPALARIHVDNGGLMGLATYLRWSKDELIAAIIEDEEGPRP